MILLSKYLDKCLETGPCRMPTGSAVVYDDGSLCALYRAFGFTAAAASFGPWLRFEIRHTARLEP